MAINNVTTTRSNFTVGNGKGVLDITAYSNFSGCDQNIGLLLQNTSQFRAEENRFDGIPHTGGGWSNFGVVVSNSGGTSNNVYRNHMDSLNVGVYPVGENQYGIFGLTVLCNTFSHISNGDIYIASDGDMSHSQGIGAWQFDGIYPAGNTFSGSAWNIVNYGQPLIYNYNTVNYLAEEPNWPSTPGGVTVHPVSTSASCPTNFPGDERRVDVGTGSLDHSVLSALKVTRGIALTTLVDSQDLYKRRIDFGNTDSLTGVIAASTDTGILYATLAGGSPYISVAALDAVVSHVALPHYSMVQLMLQNPEDLLNSNLMAHAKAVYLLTTNEMSSLATASATETGRTTIERSILAGKQAVANYDNVIMMALKSPSDPVLSLDDTTGANLCTDSTSVYYRLDSNMYYMEIDSVGAWLQNIGDLWTRYAQVGYENYRGHYGLADTMFADIYNHLPARSADTEVYNTYSKLWTVMYAVETGSGVLWQLDSSQIAYLDTSAAAVIRYNIAKQVIHGVTGVVAPWFYSPYPCPPVYVLLGGRQGQQQPENGAAHDERDKFYVYPNPTNGGVTFAYDVPDAGGDVTIVVTNVVGEQVAELHTGNNTGKLAWNPARVVPGVYIYSASGAKGVVSKGKIVVVR
jgi:hypothetical protein